MDTEDHANCRIRIISVSSGTVTTLMYLSGAEWWGCVVVDEDILIAHTRCEVHEIDTNTGNILKSYTGVQAHGITLSLDGNFIFYASQDLDKVGKINEGKEPRQSHTHTENGLLFLPVGWMDSPFVGVARLGKARICIVVEVVSTGPARTESNSSQCTYTNVPSAVPCQPARVGEDGARPPSRVCQRVARRC